MTNEVIDDGGKGEMIFLGNTRAEIEVEDGSVNRVLMDGNKGAIGGELELSRPYYLDKFTLFETSTNFYIVGRDKERLRWRVLKIGRSEPSGLSIFEDPTTYSYPQCKLLLQDISEVNKLTGGRKFVTNCYGIVGFVKFLGPHYLLLITERREIGRINGHPIYSVAEYKMIPIPQSNVLSYTDSYEREKRYKKLMWLVDIRKDFFFSYSYPLMHSLQKNMTQKDLKQTSSGFVWNDYLTHQIRNHLKNTIWTVALVHGFFKQVELSTGGKNFLLTLIARRSCQFAGTRYQKRGINEDGEAANDVEIEQIVSLENNSDNPYKITSAVQNRGSIPLCWSQKHSLWNIKPEVIFSEGNIDYEATRRHFQKLCERYGNPIFLLNLVKSSGKNRRESLIGHEFQKAVDSVNTNLDEERHLNLLNLDLDAAFRAKGADVLTTVKATALNVLRQIGSFSCQISKPISFKASNDMSHLWNNTEGSDNYDIYTTQTGILRTNCLDSLDRTNVAQYVYTLVALGDQLNALGLTTTPNLDFNDKLAHDIMSICEALGDALARQYGGSAAHSKIFSKTRGQCKASTVFQELIKSMQRHISNSFLDFDKQQAIDLFLGNYQPEGGVQAAPPESNVGLRRRSVYTKKISRSILKKSQSDSDIRYNGSSILGEKSEITSSDSDFSDSRCPSYVSSGRLLTDFEKRWYGSLKMDDDIFDTQSWTGSSNYSEEDPPDEGWRTVDYPASSSSG